MAFLKIILRFDIAKGMMSKSVFGEMLMRADGLR
jgi:hypothetical protein